MIKFLQKTVFILFFLIFSAHLISAQSVNPVKNLTGDCNNGGKVSLNWTKPDPYEVDGFWLTWSSDEILGAFSTQQEGEFMSVARFAASDLTSKGVTAGDKIVQMQIVTTSPGCSQIDLKVWEGGFYLDLYIIVLADPGTLMVDQKIDLSTINNNGWTTITLDQPHLINTSSELWMGFSATANASASPLGYDVGPRTNNKSDLLNFNGQWTTLYKATENAYNLNACIKAFVTKEEFLFVKKYDVYKDGVKIGETATTNYTYDGLPPGEYEFCIKAIYSNNAASEEVCKVTVCAEECEPVTNLKVTFTEECDKAVLEWKASATPFPVKYNVYRNGVLIAEKIEGTNYVDDNFENNIDHTWSVETVCSTSLSDRVDITKQCLGVYESISDVSIYPNPAFQTVTIQVDQFQKVEIYNTVGQLVEMNDHCIVDVSNYKSGLYFFKVFDTDSNFAVRRVTVMK